MSYLHLQQRLEQKTAQKKAAERVKEERKARMAALRKTPLSAMANLPALPGSIRLPPAQDQPQQQVAGGMLAPVRLSLRSVSATRSVLVPVADESADSRLSPGLAASSVTTRRALSSSSTARRPTAPEEKVPLSKKCVMSQTLLGTGAFGAVYLGVHEDTGQMIAVKQVTIGSQNNKETQQQIEQLASEIRLMKQLEHPNIVKYLHAERDEQQLHIYMEYMSGGSLASLVKKFTKLPERVMKVYMRQVLVGLAYLHQRNVVHRDIKADNILLSSDGTSKISDFGTSREFTDSSNLLTVTGTPWFMAPEVVKGSEGSGHGTPADMWSIGATMIELVQGKPPWWRLSNPVSVMYQIGLSPENIMDEIPKDISDELEELLKLCFAEEPSHRITAKQMLEHSYFQLESAGEPEPEPTQPTSSTATTSAGGTTSSGVIPPRPPSPAQEGDVPVPLPLQAGGRTGRRSPSPPNAPGTPTVGTPRGYATRLRTETQTQQK